MGWKAISFVLILINVCLLATFWYYLHLNRHAILTPSNGIEYKDLVSLLLAALSAMIAVLTIFLAVAALWGYTALKEGAHKVAAQEARDVAATVALRAVAAREAQATPRLGGGDDYGAAAAQDVR